MRDMLILGVEWSSASSGLRGQLLSTGGMHGVATGIGTMGGRKQYEREFVKPVKGGDTVRVAFDLDRGRVTDFVVQLECWIENHWRPVARYDVAHGQAHRDVLDWDGRVVEKDWLPAGLTYMNVGVRDFVEHAETYRSEFLRSKP